jgi:hypothetical protein
MRRFISAVLYGSLLCAGGASAAQYVPFTNVLNTGPSQGLWLADSGNPGNPPIQVTNQTLDGPSSLNIAILNDWTVDATRRVAVNVQPQLAVYGVGGHLFKTSTKTLAPVQAFSNGTYQELCSLTALDERPFAAARAFVQAVVEPVGSANTCADNLGTQTWLIPANATASTPPTIKPSFWTVLGAFTDPADGTFVKWIVWSGNELDTYPANFSKATTLFVGPPAGAAPNLALRVDGVGLLLTTSVSAGIQTDTYLRLTAAGATFAASFSYSLSTACGSAGFGTVMSDPGSGNFIFEEPTNTGYALYTMPIAGGPVTPIYANNSGTECGTIGGDATSAGFVGLNEIDQATFLTHVVAVNEAGPATQTAVLLASVPNGTASIRYTIDGHYWIDLRSNTGGVQQSSEMVVDGNGTVLQTFPNSRISDDAWAGFSISGAAPAVQRALVYLFSPTGGLKCNGGVLSSVDPVTLVSTAVSGAPADTCSVVVFGWLPISLGSLTQPTGNSPIQLDPAAGQVYFLLGPQTDGIFTDLSALFGYPFF